MLPVFGLPTAIAVGAAFGAAIVLLVLGLRGVERSSEGAPRFLFSVAWLRSVAGWRRSVFAMAAGVLVLVVTRWPVAAGAAAAVVFLWPQLFGGSAAERQAMARLEALVLWTEAIRDTVAASITLEQAIPASAERAPALIRGPLLRLVGQIRAQTPLDAALLDLADDLDDGGADKVIAVLVLNVRRRGDRLPQVLTALTLTAREELDLRRRVHAGRAGLRRSVRIVLLVTLAVVGYLSAFGGTYLDPYDAAQGQIALAVAVGLFAAGFVWLRRLASDEGAQPFLNRSGRAPDPAEMSIVAAVAALSGSSQSMLVPDRPAKAGRDTG